MRGGERGRRGGRRAGRSAALTMRRLTGALLIAGAAQAGACASPGDDPGPPVAVDPAVLYVRHCARCHGADGRGNPEARLPVVVRSFADPALQGRSVEAIERVILEGNGQMPPFGASLSQPKVQALTGYVRRLAGAARAGAPVAPTAGEKPGAPARQ
jgi:mono/diheme cytochrome c family protein